MNKFRSSKSMLEDFRRYLPLAASWVLRQEQFILERGVPLIDSQLSDAKLAGVVHPERVRLLRVEEIPLPEYPQLLPMAEAMKLTAPAAPGVAMRYGIYIRSEYWGQRQAVVRELAHTAQYERLDSVSAFLECYLFQCMAVGYTAAPMEQEAIAVAQRICGRVQSPGLPETILGRVPEDKPSVRGTKPPQ